MRQTIRFCTAADGTRLAYACSGEGPPLVMVPNYLTHLEFAWDSPVWRHWLTELSQRYQLIRYDMRGCGLSDRDVGELSVEAWVGDLATVVEECGLRRFALLGMSAGAAPAVAYAARHPEQVDKLLLYGGYSRGRNKRTDQPAEPERGRLMTELIKTGWGQDNPAFRRVFTTLFVPGGTPEQVAWFDDLQRLATAPETAARISEAFHDIDVADAARAVTVPTLVLHARDDAIVPFERGRELAALIPGSEFVPLDGSNHVLLSHEPAWQRWLDAVQEFLARPAEPTDARLRLVADLTDREREVLALIARGLSNDEITERLVLSPATVRNHITRIFRKLQVRGRAQAIVLAHEAGLAR